MLHLITQIGFLYNMENGFMIIKDLGIPKLIQCSFINKAD